MRGSATVGEAVDADAVAGRAGPPQMPHMTTSKHHDPIRMADRQLPPDAAGAVFETLESGSPAAEEIVEKFEATVAACCDRDHAVATTSPAAALQAGLVAVGVGDGDRVLTAPLASAATTTAIESAGATPVFADVDPETFTLDPEAAEAVLRRTDVDAMLATHLYGLPADMGSLADLADTYDLALVENVGGALGVTYRGEPTGSFGDVACVSFGPTRPVTTGRGGAVVADDDVAVRARQFVAAGHPARETAHPEQPFRMGALAAAVGRRQIDRLSSLVAARRTNATRLRRRLADTDLVTPFEPDYATHAYEQFAVRCRRRDEFGAHLSEFGIESTVYHPEGLDEASDDPVAADLSVADRAATEILSLPVHAALSEQEVATVGEAVTYFDSFV